MTIYVIGTELAAGDTGPSHVIVSWIPQDIGALNESGD